VSDFSALNTAITGLYAHRQRIDTIGENIANIETPGYHRQRVDLQAIGTRYPGLFSGPGGQHGGVTADVQRVWDQLLDTSSKQNLARSNSLNTQADILTGVESEIGSLATNGLGNRLTALWNSFDDLANDPTEQSIRNVVLGNAEGVTSIMQAQSSALNQMRSNEVQRLELGVARVNELANRVAEMDATIVNGTAAGRPPHGLMDQRSQLLSELSGLTGATINYDGSGSSIVAIGGHVLISQAQVRPIELRSITDPALAPLGFNRIAITGATGREIALTGGSLHGGLSGVNTLVPDQRRALDSLAASIVTTVNNIHQTGAGLDGTSGRSFFDPAGVTAATIALSADVVGQPGNVAASDGSATLDNSVARALASLGTDPSGPSATHATMLADLGAQLSTMQGRADAASISYQQSEGNRQAAEGVNLDEELADLVSAQRAYEASARMVSAIDEMLDTLINRTGLVGR
jgi:flagellar hook-associated protein 1